MRLNNLYLLPKLLRQRTAQPTSKILKECVALNLSIKIHIQYFDGRIFISK